jgi:hypothetical protein
VRAGVAREGLLGGVTPVSVFLGVRLFIEDIKVLRN